MTYYRILDELYRPLDRWFLKSLNVVEENKISVWKFVMPARVELPEGEKLVISVRDRGVPLDFTFAGFSVPIVNEKVAFLFNEEDCQLIPLKVDGVNDGHLYFICVLLKCIECLDEGRSNFEKFAIDDPIRPDKAGEYKGIYKLFVDPEKIKGARIFRLKNADNIIIINEELKQKFVESNITGVRFQEVT